MSSIRGHVLLGITGSVAAIKASILINLLLTEGYEVKVIVTDAARHFLKGIKLPVPIYIDKDEFSHWKKRGDDVLHIKLRNWADYFLIAPLTANTLGKIACGLADNLLTCVARTWYFGDTGTKPCIFAPAMNTKMWNHPLTSQHIATLQNTLHWQIIPPVTKNLMCGEFGDGAMEDPEKIVQILVSLSS